MCIMDCDTFQYTMAAMHNKYAMVVSLLKGIERDMSNLEQFDCNEIKECINEGKKIESAKIVTPKTIMKNSPHLIKDYSINESDPNIITVSNATRSVRRSKKYMEELFNSLPDRAMRKDIKDTSRSGLFLRYFALSPTFNAVLVDENNIITLIKTKD